MADHNAVGATGEPFELVIELGKVREFARAIGSQHPDFLDGSAIPPTFLMVALHWQSPDADILKAARLDPQRTLHGGQQYTFYGAPLAAGTRLRGVARIDRVFAKEGGGGTLTFVEMITRYTDEGGALRAEAKLTAIETSAPPKTPAPADQTHVRTVSA